jgi:hypothetical protein
MLVNLAYGFLRTCLPTQETDVLQQEVRILEEERGRLMREVTLKTELEVGEAGRQAGRETVRSGWLGGGHKEVLGHHACPPIAGPLTTILSCCLLNMCF